MQLNIKSFILTSTTISITLACSHNKVFKVIVIHPMFIEVLQKSHF